MNAAGAVVEDTGGDLGGSLPVVVCLPVPVLVRCLRCDRPLKTFVMDAMGNAFGLKCFKLHELELEAAFMSNQLPLIEPYRREKPPHQQIMERREADRRFGQPHHGHYEDFDAKTANEGSGQSQLQPAVDNAAVGANAGKPD